MSDPIIALHKLSERINSHGGKLSGDSMAERYMYFVEHSEQGSECHLARKCRDLFLAHDWQDVLAQFLAVLEQLRIVEGKDFGR